jgi:hypothetical protein
MYMVKQNELKVVLKVSAEAGENGAENKTSVEPTVQDDDFQEVNRRKKHISKYTSQTAKKSINPVQTSAAVKLSSKAVLTRNFFPSLSTTDMDKGTTTAMNVLPQQEAPRKSGRPSPIVPSTTNLIRLQRDLKENAKGECDFRNI